MGAETYFSRGGFMDVRMRAVTVRPGIANSSCAIGGPRSLSERGRSAGRALALGVCGTDREIIAGEYGGAPPGEDRLVLGHDCSAGSTNRRPVAGCAGDLVVGIVRRPDPVPCPACAVGEWDMCRNGRYTERGIKERNGYGAERFRIEPDFAVKVDPALGILGVLLEPTSVVAKAWDHTERIGQRARAWQPKTLLVTGAGPIGLLAAMMGVQRGLDVHVLDRNTDGAKPELVRALGGTYHTGAGRHRRFKPDIVMECTGAPAVVLDVLGRTAPDGIVCLAGVRAAATTFDFDVGAFNRTMVLDNDVVFGSVNANRRHYAAAADALRAADKDWLDAPDHAPRAARSLAARRSSAGRTTSRSSSISPR